MKRRRQFQSEGSLEWIEEATQLLRTSPPGVLAVYYLGALPFVLGLLFFWADMSRSPFASEHVVEAALAVALLFLWMKTWQAVFCLHLRGLVAGEPMESMSPGRWFRVFAAQAAIQPLGLLLIPLALLIALPFAWVFGFYQNATVFAEPGAAGGESVFRRAARGTRCWIGQYHVILLLLSVFAGVVFLNWTVVCLILPGLLKMLLGIETAFSRSPFAMLNTTFFATMAGLTYLSVDPILKAFHVLRCFRGEAQATGDDLKSGLRHAVQAGPRMTMMVVLGLTCLGGSWSGAAESEGAPPPAVSPVARPASLPPQELDRSIQEVIRQQKYTWRMPREKVARPETTEQGWLAGFFTRMGDMIRKSLKAVSDWLDRLMPERSPREPAPSSNGGAIGPSLAAGARLLLYGLLVAAVVALGYLAYRVWRNRRRGPEVIEAAPMQVAPDLTDENVGAEQLPEDEWTRLARELLGRGELRLAMRAYYLSSLACLGERRLIALAKFKSNRDYERELARRGHVLGELLPMFGENVMAFDRVWYGLHSVDADAVSRFAANVEKIRASA